MNPCNALAVSVICVLGNGTGGIFFILGAGIGLLGYGFGGWIIKSINGVIFFVLGAGTGGTFFNLGAGTGLSMNCFGGAIIVFS